MSRTAKILGRAKVSDSRTISLISETRPFLEVKPGEYVQFVLYPDGTLVIEKAKP